MARPRPRPKTSYKEYESKKTIKLIGDKTVEVITVLSYTPHDGGKGYIVKIKELTDKEN
jgi:hypothetical protein